MKSPAPWFALSLLLAARLADARDALQALPSDMEARIALESSPQIKVAREQLSLGNVRAQQYRSGTHEWIAGTTAQRREEASTGARYNEQLFTLSRAWRWPNKASKDRTLGEQTLAAAGFGFEDSWHEAGRSLLSTWFEWLRAASQARLLAEQTQSFEAQLSATRRRVQAGDAPRIEEQLAQVELERAQAAHVRAQQIADNYALILRRDFPELPLNLPVKFDAPPAPPENTEAWVQRVVGHNHEIELAEAEAAVAKLAAERAGFDRLGDPTIGVNYGRERDAEERIVGISVSIPLPGAARRNEYDAAQVETRRMARLAEQTRLNVEHDARADVLNVAARYKQWQLLDALANKSGENAEVVARAYALGEFNLTETLTVRRQAIDNTIAAQNAQLDALEARARLELDAHLLWALDDHDDHEAAEEARLR